MPGVLRPFMYVAMAVRNAMESFHHDHLTDEQMAELNPIIRNAIATAYYALRHMEDPRCESFVNFQNRLIPDYWELPEITSDLRDSRGALIAPRPKCRSCPQTIMLVEERWVHTDPDRSRGCRAASYREGVGWDESLSRTAKAMPPRDWAPGSSSHAVTNVRGQFI